MRTWSRDELIALAPGSLIAGRSDLGAPAELPTWLAAKADGELRIEIEDLFETVHSEDRVTLVGLYGQAMEAPGELQSAQLRTTLFGPPAVVLLSLLNLVDQPDVGLLIAYLRRTDQPTEPEPHREQVEHQRPTDWMILTADRSAVIRTVEGNTERFLGYRHDELIGRVPAEFVTTDNVIAGIRMWQQIQDNPDATFTSRRQWVRRDGSMVWVETSYAHRTNPGPGEGPILMVIWDITHQIDAEKKLHARESELRRLAQDFQALADEVPAAAFRCTLDGSVTFHNAAWRRLLDERSPVARLHDLLAPQAAAELAAALAHSLASSCADRLTLELPGDDGTVWSLSLRPLLDGDETSFIGSLEDISDTARFREAALHDPLTGLLNRTAIEHAVRSAVASDPDRTVVVFVDLDRFKEVNDTWGHDAGDALLVEIAQRLSNVARDTDVVGRWGGDEFVLVVELDRVDATSTIVERLQAALGEPMELEGVTWMQSASIGAVRASENERIEELISRADRAMFRHKRARR